MSQAIDVELWSEEGIDTSYEPFSREPEYIEANRAFLRTLDVWPGIQVLDLACGTATMTDLLLERLFAPEGWDGAGPPSEQEAAGTRVVGVELSRESLLLGQDHLARRGVLRRQPGSDGSGLHLVDLVEATATRLPLSDAGMDLAMMGNAIQLIDDRDAMYAELRRVLRPGGRFGFNTSFYAGTYCQGTEHVYLRWVQEATTYIARRSAERKAQGLAPVKRARGTAGRAFSRPWLASADYARELEEHGFKVIYTHERTVMLDQRCFETIGAYAGLARVLLSGYPVKLASEALQFAAGPTLEGAGMPLVPRYWLEMVVERVG
jgi:ubiquinone/menaquinone biosynthesis C-methylase UbiE